MLKTMTNGEYLRLCKAHGVAPVYLDEKPKRLGPKTKDVFKTTEFVLIKKPKPIKPKGKPHNKTPYQRTPYDQERLKKSRKTKKETQ